ncbi:MAG TPA: ATP-binding protein [Candidatus Pacearchaeota archaeon]|nr:ATP-binding protein [Candidatus Pacearchaeota archaeon]HPR79758.1 ATP-binding protein [Candidatus Pacearchaeota archaeon]
MNIKRSLFEEIKNHLSKKEITLIVGPRQVGKTTIMEELIKHLEEKGEKTVFFNLDYDSDKKLFDSQENLIKKIEFEIGNKGYVFIDEIQRKENAGLFLKGIYDRNLSYKFIVSGSGSLELKEKITESLAGRKRMFLLRPINLKELINFKTNYKYEDRIDEYFDVEPKKSKMFLEEYLNFGGYPKIILEKERSEKNKIMDDIFHSCIEKDLLSLLNIDRPEAFSLMTKILSSQTGQILNYSTLGKQVGLTFEPLKKYLWYAEKTFLVELSFPYFLNKQKEITKSPLVYFLDLGLRNFSIDMMGKIDSPEKFGLIFQNFIFNVLREKTEGTAATINFWRTLSGSEVDFIINKGNEIIPIEVKYSDIKNPDIEKSLISFIEKYDPKEAWIVNLSLRANKKIGNTNVKFLPYYDLLKTGSI